MTAAYMKNPHSYHEQYSLFPDVDPNSATWTGPPPRISTALLILDASFAISVLAACFAIAGRQWTDQYLQPRGGSAADKSQDRQRELNGFQKWHINLCIKGPPLMLLQAIALLFFSFFFVHHNVYRTAAGVIILVSKLPYVSFLGTG